MIANLLLKIIYTSCAQQNPYILERSVTGTRMQSIPSARYAMHINERKETINVEHKRKPFGPYPGCDTQAGFRQC